MQIQYNRDWAAGRHLGSSWVSAAVTAWTMLLLGQPLGWSRLPARSREHPSAAAQAARSGITHGERRVDKQQREFSKRW